LFQGDFVVFHSAAKREERKKELVREFSKLKESGVKPNIVDLSIRLKCSDSWARTVLREAGIISSPMSKRGQKNQDVGMPDEVLKARIAKVRKWKLMLGDRYRPANLSEEILDKILK
jgi:hypothetical protein